MVILGLGSNIGDRAEYLHKAVQSLSAVVNNIHCSRVFESAPLLPADAPADWALSFLNMVLCGDTPLSADALLVEVKSIERGLGRTARGVWGPREIDIDILAMDDVVMDTPILSIPHRSMMERDFVLLPLLDVAPDWRCPRTGVSAVDAVQQKGFKLGDTLRDTGVRVV